MSVADFLNALKTKGEWYQSELSDPFGTLESFEQLHESLTGYKFDKLEKVYSEELHTVFPEIFEEIEDEYEALKVIAEKLHDPQNGIYILGVHRPPEHTVDDIIGSRIKNSCMCLAARGSHMDSCS